MAYARDNFDSICFDFHASPAAVPLLAPTKFAIDPLQGDRNARGEPRQGGDQTLAVGFPRSLESKHSVEVISYQTPPQNTRAVAHDAVTMTSLSNFARM